MQRTRYVHWPNSLAQCRLLANPRLLEAYFGYPLEQYHDGLVVHRDDGNLFCVLRHPLPSTLPYLSTLAGWELSRAELHELLEGYFSHLDDAALAAYQSHFLAQELDQMTACAFEPLSHFLEQHAGESMLSRPEQQVITAAVRAIRGGARRITQVLNLFDLPGEPVIMTPAWIPQAIRASHRSDIGVIAHIADMNDHFDRLEELLALLGLDVGAGSYIGANTVFEDPASNVIRGAFIGPGCFIGRGVKIDLKVGDKPVYVEPGAVLTAGMVIEPGSVIHRANPKLVGVK